MLELSQSYVSRIIDKTVKKIGLKLNGMGIIELKKEDLKCLRGNKLSWKKKIYEYFEEYTKEQIDDAVSKLTQKDRDLLLLRYGEDLDNPVFVTLSGNASTRFYNTLIPRIKKILKNTMQDAKFRNVRAKKKESNDLTKDDYIKFIELLKSEEFTKTISILSPKESTIMYLKLGYVNGKYFSTSSIARLLDIEEKEVIETINNVILLQEGNVNNVLDGIIEENSNKSKTYSLNKKTSC